MQNPAYAPLDHQSGKPDTIADALRTTLGSNTWPIVRDNVERVLRVEEAEIVRAMKLVFERSKQVIEPSAAVAVAAVLGEEFASLDGKLEAVGVVLCGGNCDLEGLSGLLKANGEQ